MSAWFGRTPALGRGLYGCARQAVALSHVDRAIAVGVSALDHLIDLVLRGCLSQRIEELHQLVLVNGSAAVLIECVECLAKLLELQLRQAVDD